MPSQFSRGGINLEVDDTQNSNSLKDVLSSKIVPSGNLVLMYNRRNFYIIFLFKKNKMELYKCEYSYSKD